jgi:hypothetical protein
VLRTLHNRKPIGHRRLFLLESARRTKPTS